LGFSLGAISAIRVAMNQKANALADRLKRFATRIVKFARSLPRDSSSDAIARQLTKSGTSEAANYHSARRARSRPEFIAKMGVAAEEADETETWLGIIANANIVSTTAGLDELAWLADESRQFRAILVASHRTARTNYAQSQTKSSNRSSGP
jgi:four helix bundle protein